jgi:hypothetical protein
MPVAGSTQARPRLHWSHGPRVASGVARGGGRSGDLMRVRSWPASREDMAARGASSPPSTSARTRAGCSSPGRRGRDSAWSMPSRASSGSASASPRRASLATTPWRGPRKRSRSAPRSSGGAASRISAAWPPRPAAGPATAPSSSPASPARPAWRWRSSPRARRRSWRSPAARRCSTRMSRTPSCSTSAAARPRSPGFSTMAARGGRWSTPSRSPAASSATPSASAAMPWRRPTTCAWWWRSPTCSRPSRRATASASAWPPAMCRCWARPAR